VRGYIYRGRRPPRAGSRGSGTRGGASRVGDTRGGAPPKTLIGCLPCNPNGLASGEAPLGVAATGEAAPGVAHPCNPNGPAASL
jgi:hypothetical protein